MGMGHKANEVVEATGLEQAEALCLVAEWKRTALAWEARARTAERLWPVWLAIGGFAGALAYAALDEWIGGA